MDITKMRTLKVYNLINFDIGATRETIAIVEIMNIFITPRSSLVPLCHPSSRPPFPPACGFGALPLTSCVTLGKLPPLALVWGNNTYFYKVMRLNGIKIAFIFTCFWVKFLFMHAN